MFNRTHEKGSLSIKTRITLMATLVILIVVAALSIASFWNAQKLLQSSELQTNQLIEQGVRDEFARRLDNARSSILSVTTNPEIAKALALRDRDTLAQEVQPIFNEIKKEGFNQMQFHLPPAISFYRAHMPSKFGDDLSSFRHTVVAANQEGKIIEGLEEGVDGYGFRVVAPIQYEGKKVGSAEYGMDFGEDFLKALQQKNPGVYSIYILNPETSMVKKVKEDQGLLASTGKDEATLPPETVKKLTDGKSQYLVSPDQKSTVLLLPFKDYTGEVKGYIKAVISREKVLSQFNSLKSWVGGIGVIVLILGILAGYGVSKVFTDPLLELANQAEILATGNLDVRFNKRYYGELHTLSLGMKKMVENTRSICTALYEAVGKVESTALEISQAAKQTASGSEQVATSVSQVADGAQGLAETTGNMNQQTEEISHRLLKLVEDMKRIQSTTSVVASRTEHGQTMMQDLAAMMKLFTEKVGVIRLTGHSLETHTLQIRGITEIITGISAQTNLLALNAAIEAARAGEAGRGFAVVADEVRKLAEEARLSATQIAERIDLVTQNVESTVESTEAAAKLIEEQAGIGERALVEFLEISGGTQAVADLLNDIQQEVIQVAGMGRTVWNEVNEVASMTREDAAAAEEIAASAEEMSAAASTIRDNTEVLLNLMDELKGQNSRFKLD